MHKNKKVKNHTLRQKLWDRYGISRRDVLVWFGLFLASIMFTYPEFADAVSNIEQVREISSYADDVGKLKPEELQEEFDKAEAYNSAIYQEQQVTPFSYRGAGATDEEYENILKTGMSNTMCYVEVPKVKIYLGVAHGTREYNLRYEAGHMYGTSLPIGTEGSNAVIAGHTGLTNADIFSNLDKMKKGGKVYIHILNQVHEYTIRDIYIVLPDDEAGYLQAISGKVYVTLYTCTPYGVNDHRLIIRGEKTGVLNSGGKGGDTRTQVFRSQRALIKAVILGSIPTAMLLGGVVILIVKARKRKKLRKNVETEEAEKRTETS